MHNWNGVKPTEDGWYWYRHNEQCVPTIVLLQRGVVYTPLAINGRMSIPIDFFPPGLWSFKLQPPLTDAEAVELTQKSIERFSGVMAQYESRSDDH